MIHPTAIIEENVTLGKNCRVWAFAHIRTGATIVCGVEIGEGATIGAGSVVTRSIPAKALAYGNPAKIKNQ